MGWWVRIDRVADLQHGRNLPELAAECLTSILMNALWRLVEKSRSVDPFNAMAVRTMRVGSGRGAGVRPLQRRQGQPHP
jgi:hypothetical protein